MLSFARRVVVLLVMTTCLTPLPAQFNMDQLAKTLSLQTMSGKIGNSFILNRNITDGLTIPTTDTGDALAKAVGFCGADGSLAPVCLRVPWSADWIKTVKQLHQEGKLKTVQFIDIGSPVDVIRSIMKEMEAKHSKDQAAFVDYLKNQKVDATGLGLKSLDEAKLNVDKAVTPLGFYSRKFLVAQTMAYLRDLQLEVVRLQPELAFGAPYAGDFEQNSDALVLEAWRTKALIPWVAERSWQNGEYSLQALGYYLALARSANAKQPVICDIHVGTNHYSIGIRRAFYLALGNGAKRIRFVGAVPPSLTKDADSLSMDSIDTWKALRELTHDAGRLELVLEGARPKEPDVALLVSLTQSLYDPSAWVSEEYKAIFVAARRSGHNIGVLTEEDVQEGKFQKISSIFVCGRNLQKETAKVFKSYVMNGASLSCTAGPYLDEYNQPLPTMLELLGIKDPVWQQLEPAGAAKKALAQVKPTDLVKFTYMGKTHEFPVVYGKLKITPDEQYKDRSIILGKYNDESVAVLKHEVEPVKLGFVWLFNSPIGSGWLKTSLNRRKYEVGANPLGFNHLVLFDMLNGDAGDVVISATGDARFDVITDNLSVESMLLEKKNSFVMVTINWSNKPQQAWLTAQFIPKGIDKLTSVFNGLLNGQRAGITFSLPKRYEIKVADVFVFE